MRAGEDSGVGVAPPFELVNAEGTSPVLLLCDHASNLIPSAFQSLGLDDAHLARHIAWDLGAAEVTRVLSRRLDAPAVLSRYSRLIVDVNREPGVSSLIPEEVDGVVVPGNRGLSAADRERRVATFHRPYHRAIDEAIDRLSTRGQGPAVVSIHSFTPVMEGVERPWPIGILSNRDKRLSHHLIAYLCGEGLIVGDNEPYSGRDIYGFTVQLHADPLGLANVVVELRQDLIDTPLGVTEWAERLEQAILTTLEDPQVLDRDVAP